MFQTRFVTLNSNALEIIKKEHCNIKHFVISKTYKKIIQNYYKITKTYVK
jgi:hypothetical protein